MSSTRRRRIRFTWPVVAVLAVSAVVVGACGADGLSDHGSTGGNQFDATSGGGCYAGRQGCTCSPDGAKADCGHVVQNYGSYVTCSEGTSMCAGGTWGACVGDTIVTKSIGGATIGQGGGLRPLAGAVACTDPCDPNSCMQTTDGPGDVPDGAPVLITDAGVTLQPTITYEGGGGDGGACTGLQCQVDWSCPMASRTTLTGKVFDPAGNNPLYNAYVYIPVDPDPTHLPAFTQGVTCDNCSGAGNLNAVAVAQTDAGGNFTLTNVPTSSKAPGKPIPLVIQMGKWRRVTLLPSVPDCASTAVPAANSRLPRNQTDGYNNHADLPQVAFVSGSADPFECMLLKAGIDPNEFGSSTLNSGRRFHYYNSPDSRGNSIDPAFGNVVTGDAMWNNTAGNSPWGLSAYDVVILACEGDEYDRSDRDPGGYSNLVTYAAAGGRVFMTHYSYVWMKYNSPWQAVPASWVPPEVDTQDPMNTAVVTAGFPKGQSFNTWLGNVGALDSNGFLEIHEGRQDTNLPLASTVQPWLTVEDTSNENGTCATASCFLDSDCPVGSCNGEASGVCADNAAKSCTAASTCKHGNGTCSGSPKKCGGTNTACATNADCNPTCNGAVKGNCTCGVASECPGGGACNNSTAVYSPAFTFNAPISAQPANQCGRAVFTDFHVATSAQVGSSSCNTTADCGAGSVCGGASGIVGSCTALQCDPTQSLSTSCGDSTFTCPGGTAGKCGCYENSDCTTMGAGTCTGNTLGACSTSTCYQNSDCTGANTCGGGTLGKCGCYQNSDCPSGSCSGGVLGRCANNILQTCEVNSDCPAAPAATRKCNLPSPIAGTCSVPTCKTAATCTAGPLTCVGAVVAKCSCGEKTDCASNSCTGRVAGACTNPTCFANNECSTGTKACTGGITLGTCAPDACTTNAQCSGSEKCINGTCNGCFQSSDCPGGGQSCVGGVPVGTCSGSRSNFPYECKTGLLDPQEAALEFLFFDLSACVSPNNNPPPGPPQPIVTYSPVTFTVDFQSSCPTGTAVKWRELDWQANIPATASIVFSAQTAAAPAGGGLPNYSGVQLVPIVTATTTTPNLPTGWNAALIDVTGLDAGALGAFNTASPAVASQADLRLTITLNPTTDLHGAPTLIQWQLKSDCPPAE